MSLQRCCLRAMARCCREHRTNANCSNQSRHQTALSLHSFLGTQLNTIFHSDSSNYYRSPLSFSWHFSPDVPSIINCHIMKFQQRMGFYSPSFFLPSQSTLQSFQSRLKRPTLPAVSSSHGDSRLVWLEKLCALYYGNGCLSKTAPWNLCPPSALNSFEMLL